MPAGQPPRKKHVPFSNDIHIEWGLGGNPAGFTGPRYTRGCKPMMPRDHNHQACFFLGRNVHSQARSLGWLCVALFWLGEHVLTSFLFMDTDPLLFPILPQKELGPGRVWLIEPYGGIAWTDNRPESETGTSSKKVISFSHRPDIMKPQKVAIEWLMEQAFSLVAQTTKSVTAEFFDWLYRSIPGVDMRTMV